MSMAYVFCLAVIVAVMIAILCLCIECMKRLGCLDECLSSIHRKVYNTEIEIRKIRKVVGEQMVEHDQAFMNALKQWDRVEKRVESVQGDVLTVREDILAVDRTLDSLGETQMQLLKEVANKWSPAIVQPFLRDPANGKIEITCDGINTELTNVSDAKRKV